MPMCCYDHILTWILGSASLPRPCFVCFPSMTCMLPCCAMSAVLPSFAFCSAVLCCVLGQAVLPCFACCAMLCTLRHALHAAPCFARCVMLCTLHHAAVMATLDVYHLALLQGCSLPCMLCTAVCLALKCMGLGFRVQGLNCIFL